MSDYTAQDLIATVILNERHDAADDPNGVAYHVLRRLLDNPDALKAWLVEAGVLVQPSSSVGWKAVQTSAKSIHYVDSAFVGDRPLYLWAPETGETPDHE